mmetsp:Transcript_43435/g.114487  ORF Transcript_43435/g.114487 Transcript_43435/m.114487 type:complete len:653 (-) Transcript_43435:79-2037(-)
MTSLDRPGPDALEPVDLAVLRGGVSVITGSASGIGYALAKACASLGMHVVLSDKRPEPLKRAVDRLRLESHGQVEGFVCDVAELESVEDLLASTVQALPGVPIQFLGANAGVMLHGSGVLMGSTEAWEFTHKVNALGVVHTLRTFVPVMAQQTQRAVVEVTSSGFAIVPGMRGPYGTSKLASLGIAEAMYYELQIIQASLKALDTKITFAALCPAVVATDIVASSLEVARDEGVPMMALTDGSKTSAIGRLTNLYAKGMSADYCASELFRSVQQGRFYCVIDTDDSEEGGLAVGTDAMMQARVQAMVTQSVPPPLQVARDVASRKVPPAPPPPRHTGCWSWFDCLPFVAKDPRLRRMDLGELRGGVAVITGSASGIGFAMAKECLRRGMHVLISDIRERAMEDAVAVLRRESSQRRVESVHCDVTQLASVRRLLATTRRFFPGLPIQFVGANAGILLPQVTVLTGTSEEWQRTYNVNVLGIVNTLQTFVPVLAEQTQSSILEVTASGFGIVPGLRGASVGVAEATYYELLNAPGSPLDRITIVALCAAVVKTDILDTSSVATDGSAPLTGREGDPASKLQVETLRSVIPRGMPAEAVSREVFQHAREGRFYCIVDNDPRRDGFTIGTEPMLRARMDAILRRETPPLPKRQAR